MNKLYFPAPSSMLWNFLRSSANTWPKYWKMQNEHRKRVRQHFMTPLQQCKGWELIYHYFPQQKFVILLHFLSWPIFCKDLHEYVILWHEMQITCMPLSAKYCIPKTVRELSSFFNENNIFQSNEQYIKTQQLPTSAESGFYRILPNFTSSPELACACMHLPLGVTCMYE